MERNPAVSASGGRSVRRHPEPRRLATLVATVRSLEAKAADDALELFDVLMTNDLMARAARESRKEKLRRYPRLSKDAGKLAAAVGVPLDALEHEQQLSLDLLWEAIESTVSRAELRAAVAHLGVPTTSSRRTTLSVSRRVASPPPEACADAGQSVDR